MKTVIRIRKLFIKIPKNSSCVSTKFTPYKSQHQQIRFFIASSQVALASQKSSSPSSSLSSSLSDQKSVVVVKQAGIDHDLHVGHYERNFITATRAMQDFLLKPEHLVSLRVTTRRSPNENAPSVKVYWRKDIEAKSIQIWGSLEAMEGEKEKLLERTQAEGEVELGSFFKRIVHKKRERKGRNNDQSHGAVKGDYKGPFGSESGQVVGTAIVINSLNFVAKGVAWVSTGSHAMFSEMIHSAADTVNQMILAYGIKTSTKTPNTDHPYGYSNMQYVSSLISAVGIFCMGAGLSIYHGIEGLSHPHELESIKVAAMVLTGSFVSESVTLGIAIKSIRNSAKKEDMNFAQYVVGGYDPCVNVVLLEDLAAVLGVVIAGGSMALSLHLGSHIPDAMGSIVIGGLLGSVASFMIYTNSAALVGRSIPEEKIREINEVLEGDIMVRQIMDVKGIDMGNGIVRYDIIMMLKKQNYFLTEIFQVQGGS